MLQEMVTLYPKNIVSSVELLDGIYVLKSNGGQVFRSRTQPLLAGGFKGSHTLVSHLFEKREDGFPLLNERDESTITTGIYLCGPSVRHDNHDFCFIFKFRQRFAVVAQSIASSLGHETDDFVQAYRNWDVFGRSLLLRAGVHLMLNDSENLGLVDMEVIIWNATESDLVKS